MAISRTPHFLGDLAARIGAGPPKKPAGLVKKKALGVEDVPDAAPQNPKGIGGLGGLANAVAAAAAGAAAAPTSGTKPSDKS